MEITMKILLEVHALLRVKVSNSISQDSNLTLRLAMHLYTCCSDGSSLSSNTSFIILLLLLSKQTYS